MSTNCDKALVILQQTNDGNDLSPGHLRLVEAAVNGHLTEEGQVAFDVLHNEVTEGTYQKPWLFGMPGLTIDHEGYVYWKGQCVEHYTFYDDDSRKRLQEQAAQLCLRCVKLESKGIPINGRTALDSDGWFTEAPGNTLWVSVLMRYYNVMSDGSRTVLILSVRGKASDEAECYEVTKDQAGVTKVMLPGLYEAFHHYQNQGFTSIKPTGAYAEVVSFLTGFGFTEETFA